MKITKFEGTSGYIKVHIDDKRVVKIQGEFIVGGFWAYTDSIQHWEPPFQDELINDKTKDQLIKAIIDRFKDSKFKIEID